MSLFGLRKQAQAIDKFYADNWLRTKNASDTFMNFSIDNFSKAQSAKSKKAKDLYLFI